MAADTEPPGYLARKFAFRMGCLTILHRRDPPICMLVSSEWLAVDAAPN
jgi:hypothetical protein